MDSRLWIRQLFLWITVLGSSGNILQAQIRERMVIATGVVCRAQPDESSRQVHIYGLGDIVGSTDESKDEKGSPWFFDQWRISGQSPSCWVYGPLTTEFVGSNPVPALLAAMDHVLHRQNEARFEDYVAVENLLSETRFDSIVQSSGILQFRKLSIVNQAISREEARGHVLDREPLKKAWVLAHGSLVSYFEPGDEWVMRPEAYWNLYEQYKQEPWAEDLAWAAAQLTIPGDECYAGCLLEKIDKTFLQYWSRYPNGYAVSQSLIEAAQIAKDAADVACFDKATDYSVPRPVLDKIRKSLVEVTAPQKNQLLQYIDQIERKCYPGQR